MTDETDPAEWPVGTILRHKTNNRGAQVVDSGKSDSQVVHANFTYVQQTGLDFKSWRRKDEWEPVWIPEPALPDGINKSAGGWYWHDDAPGMRLGIDTDGTWLLARRHSTCEVTTAAFEAFAELTRTQP